MVHTGRGPRPAGPGVNRDGETVFGMHVLAGATQLASATGGNSPVALGLAGLIVGFTVGLTGMGGGALMTPILVLIFGITPSTGFRATCWRP